MYVHVLHRHVHEPLFVTLEPCETTEQDARFFRGYFVACEGSPRDINVRESHWKRVSCLCNAHHLNGLWHTLSGANATGDNGATGQLGSEMWAVATAVCRTTRGAEWCGQRSEERLRRELANTRRLRNSRCMSAFKMHATLTWRFQYETVYSVHEVKKK